MSNCTSCCWRSEQGTEKLGAPEFARNASCNLKHRQNCPYPIRDTPITRASRASATDAPAHRASFLICSFAATSIRASIDSTLVHIRAAGD